MMEQATYEKQGAKNFIVSYFSLFSSLSTLICCALPALFVALGMGGVVVGMTSHLPWLITLSMYKEWLFAGSFIILIISSMMIYRARNLPCPIDIDQRMACQRTRKISIVVTAISYTLWLIGFIIAFFPQVIFSFYS